MPATVCSRRLSRCRAERGSSGAQLVAELGVGQPQLFLTNSGQVVTFAADARAGLSASFRWTDEHDAEAIYVDGETSRTVQERDGAIGQYGPPGVRADPSAAARESLGLINTVIKEISP